MNKRLALICILGFTACTAPKSVTPTIGTGQQHTVIAGKIWGSLFQQQAAEYAALCYQAFNMARMSLAISLLKSYPKPLAIITDIDETILDNSPYAVQMALAGKDYEPTTWYNWTQKASASPVPGSLEFFHYAASRGVAIFYITNRDNIERKSTLANLKQLQFPQAEDDHLVLKDTESSKESRRLAVAKQFEIVMLLGDNLSDFSLLWDKKPTAQRMLEVQKNQNEFGRRFIVLPNITYGGWEDALYGNRYNLSPAQKDSAIKANIKGY